MNKDFITVVTNKGYNQTIDKKSIVRCEAGYEAGYTDITTELLGVSRIITIQYKYEDFENWLRLK